MIQDGGSRFFSCSRFEKALLHGLIVTYFYEKKIFTVWKRSILPGNIGSLFN